MNRTASFDAPLTAPTAQAGWRTGAPRHNLPAQPRLPQDETLPGLLSTLGAAVLLGVGLILSFRKR